MVIRCCRKPLLKISLGGRSTVVVLQSRTRRKCFAAVQQGARNRFAQDSRLRPDKILVTDLLRNAERIFETAASADGAELESGTLAILIGQDGGIHMLMGNDWPLESLQSHHGASAAYRVSRTGSMVRVEGKSRTSSCVLESEPGAAVAMRMLTNHPRYLLAA